MDIRTVDVTEWDTVERVDATALPYEVIASPYGETISQRFATKAEAQEQVDYVESLAGKSYMTSWGEQAVNTEVTVLHYVDTSAMSEAQADEHAILNEDVYTVTTTAGARLGYPAYAIRDTRAEAIKVATDLHAHRVANGAEGVDAVRVEHKGRTVWFIRDNGTVSL